MRHYLCKHELHEECNGKILDASIMTGVKGIKSCTCECHKTKEKK